MSNPVRDLAYTQKISHAQFQIMTTQAITQSKQSLNHQVLCGLGFRVALVASVVASTCIGSCVLLAVPYRNQLIVVVLVYRTKWIRSRFRGRVSLVNHWVSSMCAMHWIV